MLHYLLIILSVCDMHLSFILNQFLVVHLTLLLSLYLCIVLLFKLLKLCVFAHISSVAAHI